MRLADARIRDEAQGGAAEELTATRGAVTFAHFDRPPTHRVINVGATPFRNVFVEVLPSAGPPSESPSLADVAGHTRVLACVEGDRPRVVGGKLAVEAPGKPAQTLELEPGAVQWHEAGTRHSLRNVGTAPFEAVDVELK